MPSLEALFADKHTEYLTHIEVAVIIQKIVCLAKSGISTHVWNLYTCNTILNLVPSLEALFTDKHTEYLTHIEVAVIIQK